MSSLEPFRPLSSYGEESPHADAVRRDELPRRWPTLAEQGYDTSAPLPARLHLRVGPVDVAFDGEARLVRDEAQGDAYALVALPGRAAIRLPGDLPAAPQPTAPPRHQQSYYERASAHEASHAIPSAYRARPDGPDEYGTWEESQRPSGPPQPLPIPPTPPPSISRSHLRGQGARRPSWQGPPNGPPPSAPTSYASQRSSYGPPTAYPPQPVPSAPTHAPVYAPSASASPAPPSRRRPEPALPPALPPQPVRIREEAPVVQREVVRDEPTRAEHPEERNDPPRTERRWWEWLLLLTLLALIILLVWIWRYGTVESATGHVQAEIIEATTPESGVIGQVFVDEGDRVIDGTRLFTLIDPEGEAELQQLRQQVTIQQRLVEEAETHLKRVSTSRGTQPNGVLEREVETSTAFEDAGRRKTRAEDRYEAVRQRHAAGEATQAELQQAEAALRDARSALQRSATVYGEARDAATRWQMIRAAELDPDRTSSEQSVLRDRQAELSRAKARYDAVREDQEERVVVARATGTVYDVVAGPGQSVDTGQPVLILRGDEAPWVRAEFALRDAQRIEASDPMWIDLPEMLERRDATLLEGISRQPAVQSADGTDRVALRFGFAEAYPDAQPGTRAEVEVRVGLYAWLTYRTQEVRAWWHRRIEAARG